MGDHKRLPPRGLFAEQRPRSRPALGSGLDVAPTTLSPPGGKTPAWSPDSRSDCTISGRIQAGKGEISTLTGTDRLDLEDILPGLMLTVEELFASLREDG